MDAREADNENLIRDRAIRLFTYLRELAKLKTTVTRDLSAYDGVVWFHDVPEYRGCFSVLSSPESDKAQDDIWLEVRKVAEPKKPPIPSPCLRWVEDSQESDPLVEPFLKNEILADITSNNNSGPEASPLNAPPSSRLERLSDHPEVSQEWQRYMQDSWLPWAEVYRRWKAVDHLYFQLFSIYQQLKKLGERYELLLGLGLLTWETPNNQVIRRHIVVGDAYLTFDADRAKFEVQRSPEGAKLRFETEMIDAVRLPPLEQQKSIEDLLSEGQESPWNKDEIDKVLRSWINLLSADGVYSESTEPPEECLKIPTVTFAPAIILRQRTQRSQIQCFNNIIEQIKEGSNIPSGVRLLCEISETNSDVDSDEESTCNGQTTESTLYLPLAINEEQVQIVHQLRNRKGTLVQGPPGTGKSHTIANLICHLLAQGKSVLVTSQTPRALRVLKDKIPTELAALCVTLLGNDQAARQELEASVHGINQKYSEWNPAKSQDAITSLEGSLLETRKNISDRKRLLREQREIETYHHEVAFGAYKGTAQQIACKVRDEESKFAWLDDDIEEGVPFPLTNTEFLDLVQLYRELSDDYCSELRKEVLSRESIPDVDHFVRMVDAEKVARQNLEKHSQRTSLRFLTLKQLPEEVISSLHEAMFALVAKVRSIENRYVWTPRATSDVLCGNNTYWKGLYDFMKGHLRGLREKAALVKTIEIRSPNVDRRELKKDAQDLLGHLKKGGKLGWRFFAPQVVKRTRYIMKQVYVNGVACSTLGQLELLVTYIGVLDEIDLLWLTLRSQDNREEGPILLQIGYLQQRLDSLEAVLGLEDYLTGAKGYVKAVENLAEPQWHEIEELEEMVRDIQAAASEHTFERARAAIEGIIQKVRIVQSSSRAHSLNQELLTALEGRNTKALAQCLEKLELLEKGRESLLKRNKLQEQLNRCAPKLGHQLQNAFTDNIWDQRARSIEAAWAWKQADKWLTKFRYEHNEIKLEAELKQLSKAEQETVSRIAAAKAWDNCLRRLTTFQRNNLIAWATAMRRMPKTLSAKTRPKWMRQAQECMDNCKSAIPAWIMPLYRVFETINAESEAFDVVIIDEASQTGPEGLVIQYLGKQCIVVGDSEQIAPEAIGVPEEAVDTLVNRYLEDIPFKRFYHPGTSLFSFAEILFSGKIVLREHFRCMPEIIQFSNQLCYAHTPLKPLRQYPPKRLEPIVVQHVKNGYREGPSGHVLNKPEADELVEAIVKMCSLKEYAGKTIGVISLLGEAQAKDIENKLLTRISPADLEERRVVCGDAYAFQGDERDVILLSMVDAPNEAGRPLTTEADKRRFNVAASRAKDQVVLFHTATLSDLNQECMRHKLLEYYLNPFSRGLVEGVDLNKLRVLSQSSDRRPGTQPLPFGSWFEVDVCLDIADRGFKIIPQYPVAEYYIDLVVEGTKSRLAVECDGDEWHGIEEYERDVARQRILERCGWRFFRIRGHEYYRNPDSLLVPLWKVIDEMGIEPVLGTKAHQEEVDRPASEETKTTVKPNAVLPIASNEKSTKSALVDRPPDFFYKIAQWGKRSGRLGQQEIQFIRTTGNYVYNNWHISEERRLEANRIIEKSKNLGFNELA